MFDLLIFPNSLLQHNELLNIDNIKNIYVIEHPVFFTKYKYHKQKLILHRASMKYYFDYIKNSKTKYITFDKWESLKQHLSNNLLFYEHNDHLLTRELKDICKQKNTKIMECHNPIFLSKKKILKSYINEMKNKKITHKSFYVWNRRRLNILLNNDKSPKFGKWSFDKNNRCPYPKNIKMDENINFCNNDDFKYNNEAKTYISKHFSNNPGNIDVLIDGKHFVYPVTFESANKMLKHFINNKIKYFGKYQDAFNTKIYYGFHSNLSSLMNIGLILPSHAINELLKTPVTEVSISSIEGYIRQLIGWREYTRMFYLFYRRQLKQNILNNTTKLNYNIWYNGSESTGFELIDLMIKKVLNTGYLNHIERLMVIGNFMLLTNIHPNQVFEWFQSMFVDSYNVFMYPNVYGMSQYSCGNLMMSRPYFSSSNYLLKMGNVKQSSIIKINNRIYPWTKIWNSLYYSFINKHHILLSKNYSTANIVKYWKSKHKREKREILILGKKYIYQ